MVSVAWAIQAIAGRECGQAYILICLRYERHIPWTYLAKCSKSKSLLGGNKGHTDSFGRGSSCATASMYIHIYSCRDLVMNDTCNILQANCVAANMLISCAILEYEFWAIGSWENVVSENLAEVGQHRVQNSSGKSWEGKEKSAMRHMLLYSIQHVPTPQDLWLKAWRPTPQRVEQASLLTLGSCEKQHTWKNRQIAWTQVFSKGQLETVNTEPT